MVPNVLIRTIAYSRVYIRQKLYFAHVGFNILTGLARDNVAGFPTGDAFADAARESRSLSPWAVQPSPTRANTGKASGMNNYYTVFTSSHSGSIPTTRTTHVCVRCRYSSLFPLPVWRGQRTSDRATITPKPTSTRRSCHESQWETWNIIFWA